ncbi:MAG: phosphorylase [Calothrix sp. FI2-JRJ7]|nr:phosphorylase [Calothrix sp. FI2-JRJ7]
MGGSTEVLITSCMGVFVFVPQGAEYKAVCNGLKRVNKTSSQVISIPVGGKAVTKYLQEWYNSVNLLKDSQPYALVMGLCGSLKPDYDVGDVVLYESCIYQDQVLYCDNDYRNQLKLCLKQKVSIVKALTSDSVVFSKDEKISLGKSGASVVDMEGFSALEFLSSVGFKVGMLRVVSDGCKHNLPNLNSAFSPEGALLPLPLALGMLRQPIAASRLIYGSLQGLKVLENVTRDLDFYIS